MIRTEFNVDGSKQVSITLEPFFILNLEISRCEEIENCLESFFTERVLNDYKNSDGINVRAIHRYQIDKLPKILILHLKRFIYKDRPIKMKEDIYFP
jgi:ubiquitin C-terminal hydrolase